MTGSTYQMINGIILISTFFGCRIVWGSLNSIYVFRDIWFAMNTRAATNGPGFEAGLAQDAKAIPSYQITGDHMQFAGSRTLPMWLALSYLAANIVLNILNYYWFAKMIQTIRKRFDPPFGTKEPVTSEKKEIAKTDEKAEIEVQRGLYADGRKTVEVGASEVRSRRRG